MVTKKKAAKVTATSEALAHVIKAELASVVENVNGQDFDNVQHFGGEGEMIEFEEGGLCPVVQWDKVGQYMVGRLDEIKVLKGLVSDPTKESMLYILDSPTDGRVGIWGGTVLNGIMLKLQQKYGDLRGRRLGIQYLGEAEKSKAGQNPAKLFRVGVYQTGASA